LENHINNQGLAAIEKLGDEALNVRRGRILGNGIGYRNAFMHNSLIDEALNVKICLNLRRGYSQGNSVGYRNAFINNVVKTEWVV
jgi:hypothetical protein